MYFALEYFTGVYSKTNSFKHANPKLMRAIFFLLLSFFLFHVYVHAQNLNNNLFRNLLQDSTPVSFISEQKEPILYLGDSVPFKSNPQQFIKNGKDLYMFVDGTGRLYKVVFDRTAYSFLRMDSTSHFGYNIGAFAFSFNNNIYNLGGYGLWRMNGQLRLFNENARQWDIVKLNKEIPFLAGSNSLIWYDLSGKKIYLGYYINRNEAVKTSITETEFVYDVMVLDLINNEWTKVGLLNPYIKNNLPITGIVTLSPWGQLVSMGDKFILIDYIRNQLLTLDIAKEGYQSFQREMNNGNCYFKDSTLFYSTNAEQRLDSVQFHYSDFKPTGEAVYTNDENIFVSNYSLPFIVASILLLIATAIYIFKKYFTISINKKQPTMLDEAVSEDTNALSEETKENNGSNHQQLFDEKELQLLLLLIDNSAKGKTTSIDDLNKVMGLTKKPVEIQKKQRSDTITSINKKYSFTTRSDEPIIEKNRTEFDKRSFEYFIAFEKLGDIRFFLKH